MAYLISEADLSRQRLLAKILNPNSEVRIAEAGPDKSGRWLDLATGLGETAKMLAKLQRPGGSLVGLDQDSALLDVARAQDWGDRDVSFVEGDATELPFDDDSFDFVHARYLLVHVPDPVKVLREMQRVAKPGGIVMAKEPDFGCFETYPPTDCFLQVAKLACIAFADAYIGRKLLALFEEAGFSQPTGRTGATLPARSDELRIFARMSYEAVGSALTSAGRLEPDNFQSTLQQLREVEADPQYVFIGTPPVTVWATV